jgi:hypothetical protein
MRHQWSLLAGVVAAPVTWLLIAFGQGQSTETIEGWLDRGTFDSVDLIQPAAYLGAAGVVLGLVATLRISPLGPLVAGLLLAGVYGAMFADPFAVRDRVPDDWKLFGDPIPLRTPLTNGTLLLIGVLLIMSVLSAQRWRTWPAAAPAVAAEPPAYAEPEEGVEPGMAGEPGAAGEPATDTEPAWGGEAAGAPAVAGEPDVPTRADEAPAPPAAWPSAPATTPGPPAPARPTHTAAANTGADGSDQPPAAGASSPWSAPPRSPGSE